MRFRNGLGAALIALLTAPAGADAGPVHAVLELGEQFYYAGKPFQMRVNIVNDGDAEVKNPVKVALREGLEVRNAAGEVVPATGKPKASEPSRPEKLGSKGFYGAVFDLTEVFPELKKPGRFQIRWRSGAVESQTVAVIVIPPYDPSRRYRARFETDMGSFVVDLLADVSPIATKAFVDLANAGFYDGLLFHEVRPDVLVAGGDPSGTGSGGAPLRFPAESSGQPIVAGTVVLKPSGVAPPANGSQFMIFLEPEPSLTGQLTVVGQVVDGLDTVQKISRVPSTQKSSRPYFKPLKDVKTTKVTIVEKGAEGKATAP